MRKNAKTLKSAQFEDATKLHVLFIGVQNPARYLVEGKPDSQEIASGMVGQLQVGDQSSATWFKNKSEEQEGTKE